MYDVSRVLSNYDVHNFLDHSTFIVLTWMISPWSEEMLKNEKTFWQNTTDLQLLCPNDRAMIRWICGTEDQEETPSA